MAPPFLFSSLTQLYLVNINSERIVEIPCLGESPLIPASRSTCGIHSVCCSPSREWLATGGANPNQLAFYHLPEFQPFALGSVSPTCYLYLCNNILKNASFSMQIDIKVSD